MVEGFGSVAYINVFSVLVLLAQYTSLFVLDDALTSSEPA